METSTTSDNGSASTERHSLVLDIVSDTICPWCFVAKRRLDRAIEEFEKEGHGVTTIWRPFELNPQMPPEGLDRKAYRSAKFGSWEKSRSLDAGVIEASVDTSIEWDYDAMEKTPNTFGSHCLVRMAFEQGGADLQSDVIERLFSAYFEQGRDVGDPSVLTDLAAEVAIEAGVFPEDSHTNSVAASVRGELDIAERAQITGVPSVLAGKLFLYSGAQTVRIMVEALQLAAKSPQDAGPASSIYLS